MVRIAGATPVFDLMSNPVDCVNKIEITPAALPLAPAVTELEFRGPLLESGWSVSLKEEIGSQFSIVPRRTVRSAFPVCFETGPRKKHCYSATSPVLNFAQDQSKKPQENAMARLLALPVTSQRESFSAKSGVKSTLNSVPASSRNELPSPRSNSS